MEFTYLDLIGLKRTISVVGKVWLITDKLQERYLGFQYGRVRETFSFEEAKPFFSERSAQAFLNFSRKILEKHNLSHLEVISWYDTEPEPEPVEVAPAVLTQPRKVYAPYLF